MSDKLYSSVESVVTGNGKTLLGVNLTVLPEKLVNAGPQAKTIQPWLWTITGWVVAAKVPTSLPPWQAIAQQTHYKLPDDAGEPAGLPWKPVIGAVKDLVSAAATTMSQMGGTGAATSPIIKVEQNLSLTPAGHFYSALLTDLAATPYPIPQNLNLSFFIEFAPVANAEKYLALPIFTLDGATYTPTFTDAPGDVWETSVNPVAGPGAPPPPALTMHCEFISLGSSVAAPDPLWLTYTPDPHPLVSNWPAHLLDMTAPYLDAARVMASVTDAGLKAMTPGADWPTIRESFRFALYNLYNSLGLPGYERMAWATALGDSLPDNFSDLNVLKPLCKKSATDEQELADLRTLLSGITTGDAQLKLLARIYGTTLPYPADLTAPENSAALTRTLQLQQAAAFSVGLAKAVVAARQPILPAPAPPPPSTPAMADVAAEMVKPAGPVYANLAAACPEWLAHFGVFVQKDLTQALARDLNRQAYGTDSAGGAVTTTQAAPLILPVLPLAVDPHPGAATQPGDPMHGLRGVGVLLRRTPAAGEPDTGWKSLNVASVLVGGVAYAGLPVMVPVRPSYSATLLTAFMPYSNSAFAADDFLHNYLAPGDQLTHANLKDTLIDPLVTYAAYAVKNTPLSGVPELRAGYTYQSATFAVSNAGALPVALRDPSYPAKYLPLPVVSAPGSTANVPAASVFSLSYLRTVPVGGLEARALPQTVGGPVGDVFPSIPGTVIPRAGDASPAASGGTILPKADERPGPRPPLLMVTPTHSRGRVPSIVARSSWSFALKLPSVEPLTWDRTQGYRMPADRATILDTAFRNMSGFHRAEITDPLVKSVDFALYHWDASTPAGTWKKISAPASFAPGDMRPAVGPLAKVETVALRVDVSGGDDGSGSAALSKGSVTLTNPASAAQPVKLADSLDEGEVYLLEAVLVLDDTTTLMLNFVPPPQSYQLLIEVASAAMPSVAELTKDFSVKTPTMGTDAYQRIDVRRPADRVGVWKNVHRVDFLRQSWFWTGRTQPKLDRAGATPSDLTRLDLAVGSYPAGNAAALAQWESIEFAERPATDHVELRSTPQSDGFYYTQDLSLDLRAMHLRFAPRAFSRYQGLFDDAPGSTPWYIRNCVGLATVPDVWAPCFVLSRVRTLAMPRLKALIPLMESAFVPGSPGVMAIFDGPAYNQAGFAEVMSVGITTANNPDPGSTAPSTLFQTGPDALMNSDAALPQNVPTLIAVGPIGHTRDLDLPGAKFISHSYIVRAVSPNSPEIGDPKHDLSWWFANLQFRLGLDPKCALYSDVKSEKTAGSWIQFLPGFQDGHHNALPLNRWRFQYDNGRITILDENRMAVGRDKPNERHVLHHLLVNRRVRDLAGVRREAHYGVATYDSPSGTWIMLGTPPAGILTDQLLVRFMDVRSGESGNAADATDPLIPPHSPPTDEADFWNRTTGKVMAPNRATPDDYRGSPVAFSVAILPKETK